MRRKASGASSLPGRQVRRTSTFSHGIRYRRQLGVVGAASETKRTTCTLQSRSSPDLEPFVFFSRKQAGRCVRISRRLKGGCMILLAAWLAPCAILIIFYIIIHR